jgi:DNA polymerase III epsilon subunit-like protein
MYLVIDSETTGFPRCGYSQYEDLNGSFSNMVAYDKARLVSVAWVVLDADLKEKVGSRKSYTVNANTNLYDVLCSLKNDLDEFQVKVMVAHNLKFVYKVLMSECYRYIHNETNVYNSHNLLIKYLMHQVACLAK